jgi:hypothetical protein
MIIKMQLSYAFLHEVYPNWGSSSVNIQPEIEIEMPPYYGDVSGSLQDLAEKLKPYDKLRIVDSNVVIDDRLFKSISRKFTNDNRFKILEKLKEQGDVKNFQKILELLCSSTYKNDKEFITKCGCGKLVKDKKPI